MKGLVLVVDDDAAIVDLLETALQEEGYQVRTAVGSGALPLTHDLHPDVILLDINMPGMDGVEVSRRLRADPVTADIPIIVMSAQDRLRSAADLMPVDDRLPKPFDLAHLYTMIARWATPS